MRKLLLALALLTSAPALADLSESHITGGTDGIAIGNVGDRLKVDASPAANSVSTANSTATPLGGSGVYTGTFEDLLGYADVAISVFADAASASLGLEVQWSANGTNVDDTDSYNVAAGVGTLYSFGTNARYFRVKYTNGGSAQSAFRLQTVLKRVRGKPSSHRIETAITGENDAELVKSVLTVRGPDGIYRNVPGDEDGRLIITAVNGFGADFKFADVATSSTTTVPVRRTAYAEQTTNGQRSFSSTDVDDDGSPVDTGARTLHITYYDQTGAGPFDEVITLNGTTCVATVASDIAFVEHIEVVTVGSTGSNEGTISMFVSAACGGGTIGTIGVNANQSLWGHHYVPTGKTVHITGISAGSTSTTVGCGALFILKAKKLDVTGAVDIQVSDFVRLYGQSSTFARTYDSPIKIDGPARLVLYVTPECSSAITYRASIDFFEP